MRIAATVEQSGSKAQQKAQQLSLELTIEKGWHINANKLGIENLIATELALSNERAKVIHYPKAIEKKVKFSDSPLALYQGKINIIVELKSGADSPTTEPLEASITLQSCSDKLCLQLLNLGQSIPLFFK